MVQLKQVNFNVYTLYQCKAVKKRKSPGGTYDIPHRMWLSLI